jgi:hypothetical protein
MAEFHPIWPLIQETIAFVGQKEAEMEILRQDLNHEIMFNLKDTYIALAGDQNTLAFKQLATFLDLSEGSLPGLARCVKWNNHSNSLK